MTEWPFRDVTFGNIDFHGGGARRPGGDTAGPEPARPPAVQDPVALPLNKVLMLMSNPYGTDSLQLDEELRSVDAAIIAGKFRDRLLLVNSAATRYYDLPTALQRHQPVVAHFSGHGSGTGGIVLSGDDRGPVAVPARALSETFRQLGEGVRCVVLNACFTWPQAEAIGRHVPCVVGTSRTIPDVLAIEFACGFYSAVANGASVAKAFELGRIRIDLSGRQGSETMMLIDRPEGVADRVFLHE